LVELFGEKSFAVAFIVLMAVPALPLPTGGVTHLLEAITMLLALELLVGRRTMWLPERWKRLELAGPSRRQFTITLLRRIRWVERFSRPRLRTLLRQRLSGVVFGAVVFALSLTAFVAPPFSGLDTLPALGVVMVALGVLLEDFVLAASGLVIGALGALLVLALGNLVVQLAAAARVMASTTARRGGGAQAKVILQPRPGIPPDLLRSSATARIKVAAHALTGSMISGSWPPMLFAMSQTTNQANDMTPRVALAA
jgi:hypothetical protein